MSGSGGDGAAAAQTGGQQSNGGGTQGTNANPGNESGQRTTNRTSGGGRRTGRGNSSSMDSEQKAWTGACPNIGGVLGMPTEIIDAKVPFDIFRDKLENYIMRTFDNGTDVVGAVTEMKDPADEFERTHLPADVPEDELSASAVKRAIHAEKCKAYVARESKMIFGMQKIYGLVWGQSSLGVQAVIKHLDAFEESNRKKDVIWLLKQVKSAISGLDEKTNKYLQYHQALLKFWNMRQKPDESMDAYFQRHNSLLQTLEFAGGENVLYSDKLVETVISAGEDVNRDPTPKEKEACKDRVQAMCLLLRSDLGCYSDLLEELKNASFLGKDDYPKTAADAYSLLLRRASSTPRSGGGGRHGVQFTHTEGGEGSGRSRYRYPQDDPNLVAGRNGNKWYKRCYNCNRMGHVRVQCPDARMVLVFCSTATISYSPALTAVPPHTMLLTEIGSFSIPVPQQVLETTSP